MAIPLPAPLDILEIFLQPGEFYFGEDKTRIRTLLGSCVAIVLWHPRLHIGGMCHYMLPQRPRKRQGEALDGRYAEDAMHMFMRELGRSGTNPADYQVKLFGAGQMFEQTEQAQAPRRHLRAQHGGRARTHRSPSVPAGRRRMWAGKVIAT